MKARVLKHLNWGFAAGALTGGVLVATVFALGYASAYPVEGSTYVPNARRIAETWTVAFVFATVIWSLGLTVVGYPVWWMLERQGVRGPIVAISSGMIAVYAVGLLWPPNSLEGLVEASRVVMAISGGIVGFVIERVAYRTLTPPPARPS